MEVEELIGIVTKMDETILKVVRFFYRTKLVMYLHQSTKARD